MSDVRADGEMRGERDFMLIGLAQKRNFGVENARGSVIAHWDDDDWSHPDRIRSQVDLLTEDIAVTGYRDMVFQIDGIAAWEYAGAHGFALGTSLMYRKSWWARNKFPAIQIGEDAAFVDAARVAGVLKSVKCNGMMTATIHADNTSPRQLSGDNWSKL